MSQRMRTAVERVGVMAEEMQGRKSLRVTGRKRQIKKTAEILQRVKVEQFLVTGKSDREENKSDDVVNQLK